MAAAPIYEYHPYLSQTPPESSIKGIHAGGLWLTDSMSGLPSGVSPRTAPIAMRCGWTEVSLSLFPVIALPGAARYLRAGVIARRSFAPGHGAPPPWLATLIGQRKQECTC